MAFQVGFIGFGGMICGHHLGTIRRDDVPFEAAAAFDIDPDRRAAAVERGLVAYNNLEDFLAATARAANTTKDYFYRCRYQGGLTNGKKANQQSKTKTKLFLSGDSILSAHGVYCLSFGKS